MTTGFIMETLICVISMEFVPLSRRRSSARNDFKGLKRFRQRFLFSSSIKKKTKRECARRVDTWLMIILKYTKTVTLDVYIFSELFD